MAKVEIEKMKYKPDPVSIVQGESVTWVNLDNMKHSATRTDDPCPFDTGTIAPKGKPGDSKTVAFDECEPGEYPYICTFHEGSMFGTVVIKPKA